MIVHQIFGLLGDTELPKLFKINQQKTIKFCNDNNYSYRLWDKISCTRLIKKYPEFIDLYNNVKYPIQQVDIIRFIILHYYGGLYLDMDCYPVVEELKDDRIFRVADTQTNPKKPYEIEVIQSSPCNPILLDFCRYVKTQIEEKDKIKIYDTWKCRYVYQTTGPHSFCRFLKLNNITPETYKLNNPDYDKKKLLNLTGKEDFISQISCSYK